MAFYDDVINRIGDWLGSHIADALLSSSQRERMENITQRRSYRDGVQRRSLKVKPGRTDDNVTLNLIGKAVDQSLSMLFGEGIKVDLGGVDDPKDENQDWLDKAWRVNDQDILLKRLGMMGADSGVCIAKLKPNEREDYTGTAYPRIVAMDPLYTEIKTNPNDWEQILAYVMQYSIKDENDKDKTYRQTIKIVDGVWVITDEIADRGGKFQLTNEEVWEWDFSPVVSWQNLPSVRDVYGRPDITDDLIRLQDKINYAASNINKIVRMHAHPKTYATGFAAGQAETVEWGPDDLMKLPKEASVGNLEMQSDLIASREWVSYLTKELNSIMRAVDISTVKDKLGQLTNFGVRMMYQDALAKNHDKRDLYGAAIEDLSRRMLQMDGRYNVNFEPITVIWPDPLPSNEKEEVEAYSTDLSLGIVSKQTVSKKRGYDYEAEKERIDQERAEEGNIGTELLNQFIQGRG